MSYVEYLKQQRGGFTSAWLMFRHLYRAGTGVVIAFFEGYDDPAYFLPALRSLATKKGLEVRSVVCRGKEIVLRLAAVVHRTIDAPWRALFFVDRDLDEVLGLRRPEVAQQNVFETRWYSIENYCVSESALRCVWTDFFGWELEPALETEVTDRFRNLLQEFYQHATPVMAWILAHRKKGIKLNLNNLQLSRVFEVSWDRVRRKRSSTNELSKANSITGKQLGWRSFRSAARQLDAYATDPKQYIRGKFELWFFVRFVEVLLERGVAGLLGGQSRRRGQAQMVTQAPVTALAGRIEYPSEVMAFLGVWAGTVFHSKTTVVGEATA